MLPKLDARCEKCNGYGIEWNKTFDRAVDRGTATSLSS
ncbi:hypothetical protein BTK_34211 (plasmid) [Bacillus thuringiensis serovar kurstaki str. HD-1]|nr:hypothetical protein BTK_34211 [Bacillus thuringiensis serovar kurstaki str. HD-1]